MIELESVAVKGIGVHANTVWRFRKGISVVRGGNASGKSSMFSPINALVLGHSLWAPKKGDVSVLGGSATLEMRKNKVPHTVALHKGKFAIKRDGVDLKVHTKTASRKEAASLFPWSPEMFRSSIYLHSSIPSKIVRGNPTERHKFFEDLFGMNRLDRVVDWTAAKLTEAKKAAAIINELQASLPETCPEKATIREMRARADSLIEKTTKLRTELEERLVINEKVRLRESTLEGLPEDILKAPVVKIAKYAKRLKVKLAQARMDMVEADAAVRYRDVEKNIRALESELAALGKAKDVDVDAIDMEVSDAKAAEKSLEDMKSIRASAAATVKGLSRLGITASLEKAVSILETHIQATETSLEGLREIQGGSCHVCGSPLSRKVLKDLRSEKERVLKSLRKLREQAPDDDVPSKREISDAESLAKNLPRLLIQYRRAKRQAEAFSRKREITKELKSLRSIAPPRKTTLSVKKLNALIDDLSSELEEINDALQRLRQADKICSADVKIQPTKKLRAKLTKLGEEISRLTSDADKLSYERKTFMDIKPRIDENEKVAKDLIPLTELLQAARSPKVRSQIIRKMFKTYMDALNEYASLVWSPDVTFEATFGKGRTLDMFLSRGELKSPITQLSGFESRAFDVVHALAMQKMTPHAAKCDTIILDEIEAGLDESNIRRLAEEVLPSLAKVVRKVVVITPMNSQRFYIEGAREFQMKRVKNVARLKEV